VLTLDGDPHQTRRHLLAPLFHGDSLDSLAPIIRQIAAEEIARWPIGVSFVALPRTRFMTLRIAARLLLGIQRPRLVDDSSATSLRRCAPTRCCPQPSGCATVPG